MVVDGCSGRRGLRANCGCSWRKGDKDARQEFRLGSAYDVQPGRCDLGERDDIDRPVGLPSCLRPTGPANSPRLLGQARAQPTLATPWLSSSHRWRPAGWDRAGHRAGHRARNRAHLDHRHLRQIAASSQECRYDAVKERAVEARWVDGGQRTRHGEAPESIWVAAAGQRSLCRPASAKAGSIPHPLGARSRAGRQRHGTLARAAAARRTGCGWAEACVVRGAPSCCSPTSRLTRVAVSRLSQLCLPGPSSVRMTFVRDDSSPQITVSECCRVSCPVVGPLAAMT